MIKYRLGKFFVASLLITLTVANADTCPPPPSSIDAHVTSEVSYDSNAQLYQYRYTFSNGRAAQISLESIRLFLNQKPNQVVQPTDWHAMYAEASGLAANLDWFSNYSDAENLQTDDGKAPQSSIAPGESLGGFSFKSPHPPGVIKYTAKGHTQVPTSTPNEQSDEPIPNCPGWDFESPVADTLVTGVTTGPQDPDVTPVALRLREEKGERSCGSIDPNKTKGKISVLVLSSPELDAATIDVASVRFGHPQAVPLSSRLVHGDFGIGKDPGEWERFGHLKEKRGKKPQKPASYKNLLLIYDIASLDLQCGLDHALFLQGKTNSGRPIFGGVSSNLSGCDPKKPGKRKSHHYKNRRGGGGHHH